MAKKKSKLESVVQKEVKKALEDQGWLVEVMSCGLFQKGIPDLFCHKTIRRSEGRLFETHRWVDVKRSSRADARLTKWQCIKWTAWQEHGLGVWILTGTENMEEILLGPPNWRNWWRPSYAKHLLSPADILVQEFPQCQS